jgi:hypothetical protein
MRVKQRSSFIRKRPWMRTIIENNR